jgi:riboflavin synthase alpha subunit
VAKTAGFQIIPHTWTETALPELVTGDLVNIEVDILAKYLERMKVYEQT